MTTVAWVTDSGALTAAVGAGLLDGEKALLHAYLAVSATGTAALRRSPGFGATTRAGCAVFQGRYANLYRGAGDCIFQA